MPEMYAVPSEVVVQTGDVHEKLLFVTPELESAFPNIAETFHSVDQAYRTYRLEYLRKLEASQFKFRSSTGADIDYSLIPGKGTEMLVMWAPFNDSAPNSGADRLYKYVASLDKSRPSANWAKPHSWNQTTKAAVMAETLRAIDCEMPVLTIFQPLPSVPHDTFRRAERKQIRKGDFSPAARIIEEAVNSAQSRLHGLKSETRIDTFHAHGMSLGASLAVGMAAELDVRSLTAQELIVAPKNILDLGKKFFTQSTAGEKSKIAAADYQSIPEPRIRRDIDGHGNEHPAMELRLLHGVSKFRRLHGLTGGQNSYMPYEIEALVKEGVSVVLPIAENDGVALETTKYLPDVGEEVVWIRAVEGQRIGHIIDEYVTPTVALAVLNIARTRNASH